MGEQVKLVKVRRAYRERTGRYVLEVEEVTDYFCRDNVVERRWWRRVLDWMQRRLRKNAS